MINNGHQRPFECPLQEVIRKIKNILTEAKRDGGEITFDEFKIICADKAKNIFKYQLSHYKIIRIDIL